MSKRKELLEIWKKQVEDSTKDGKYSILTCKPIIEMLDKLLKYDRPFFKKDKENIERAEWFIDYFTNWDKLSNIPIDVGEQLMGMIEDPNFNIGIHRTNLGILNADRPINEALTSIMTDGLRNYGHTNVGARVEKPDVSLTVSETSVLSAYPMLVGSYKDNNATVILSFPKDLVDDGMNIVDYSRYDEIYDMSEDGVPTIKPKYIVGVLIKNNNDLDRYYTRDEIISLNSEKKK